MDKVLEVQQQVKNNASDLNDYLRDLDSWTKQMQTKDQQLIEAKKKKKKSDQSVCTVKGEKEQSNKDIQKEITPSKKQKIEKKVTTPSSLKSAKPRDYSEWDKFDVDAACEDVDKDKQTGGD